MFYINAVIPNILEYCHELRYISLPIFVAVICLLWLATLYYLTSPVVEEAERNPHLDLITAID